MHSATRSGGRKKRKKSRLFWARRPEDAGYLREVGERVLREHPVPPERNAPPPGGGVWLIHRGRKADIMGVELPPGRRVCVKLIHDVRNRARLRTLLGLGRGRAVYRRGLQLEKEGIPGPRAMGFMECRPFGPSVFFMELLDGHETVRDRVGRFRSAGRLGGDEIRRMARSLGRYVGDLHRRGISHKDLTVKNLLILADGNGLDFDLIDYEDLRFPALGVRSRARHRNLWKLGWSVKDLPPREQLRFLRHYLLAMGEPPRAARFARTLLKRWGHKMRE